MKYECKWREERWQGICQKVIFLKRLSKNHHKNVNTKRKKNKYENKPLSCFSLCISNVSWSSRASCCKFLSILNSGALARRLEVTVYICAYKFNATENSAWTTDLQKNLELYNLGCAVWLAFSFEFLRDKFRELELSSVSITYLLLAVLNIAVSLDYTFSHFYFPALCLPS